MFVQFHSVNVCFLLQGNIGSTPGGLPFLEEEDLIKYIVGMAERSKILSLKG